MVKFQVQQSVLRWPRLRLDKIARSPEFIEISSRVAIWIDGHLDALEHELPWLIRYGQDVHQACWTSARSTGFFFGSILTASPERSATRLYGFDGSLDERIDTIIRVLTKRGWTKFHHSFTPDEDPARRESTLPAGRKKLLPPADASWQPSEGDRTPSGYTITYRNKAGALSSRRAIMLSLAWGDGHSIRRPVIENGSSDDTQEDSTKLYRVIESEKADLPSLADMALTDHEFALSVHIRVFYTGQPDE